MSNWTAEELYGNPERAKFVRVQVERLERLEACERTIKRWRDLRKAEDVIGELRNIMQKGLDREPGYQTDKEIYGAMHMKVLRLLECDPR